METQPESSASETPASPRCLLVTGATGLVGGEVVRRARALGWPVRAFTRGEPPAELVELGVDCRKIDFSDVDGLRVACVGVSHVVHAAAKVGDWGPIEDYLTANQIGTRNLLDALPSDVERFVHISSLGVYPARDHHGTDESSPRAEGGIDGYTLSKIKAEDEVLERIAAGLQAVLLRPGFVYGPRDRTVIPRILERVRDGKFAYLGSGDQLMNNISVVNLADAVLLALTRPYGQIVAEGPQLNLTDPRLVTKREFIGSVASGAGLAPPSRQVPLGVAKVVAAMLERVWKLRGKTTAPILSQARIKFLGLNLDFSSDRAQRCLGYDPKLDFEDAIAETMTAMTAESETTTT